MTNPRAGTDDASPGVDAPISSREEMDERLAKDRADRRIEANRDARREAGSPGRVPLSPRVLRALAKADRLLARVRALDLDLTDPALDEIERERSLIALEALVLSSRGSSEEDHRKQLVLAGIAAAVETFLATGAPRAADYATSTEKDALLADTALESLRVEYPEEAARLTCSDVAAAVRSWAERYTR